MVFSGVVVNRLHGLRMYVCTARRSDSRKLHFAPGQLIDSFSYLESVYHDPEIANDHYAHLMSKLKEMQGLVGSNARNFYKEIAPYVKMEPLLLEIVELKNLAISDD